VTTDTTLTHGSELYKIHCHMNYVYFPRLHGGNIDTFPSRPRRYLVVCWCAILPRIVSNREGAARASSTQQHDKLSHTLICLRSLMKWNYIFSIYLLVFFAMMLGIFLLLKAKVTNREAATLSRRTATYKMRQFWKLAIRIERKLYLLDSKEKAQECLKWE